MVYAVYYTLYLGLGCVSASEGGGESYPSAGEGEDEDRCGDRAESDGRQHQTTGQRSLHWCGDQRMCTLHHLA